MYWPHEVVQQASWRFSPGTSCSAPITSVPPLTGVAFAAAGLADPAAGDVEPFVTSAAEAAAASASAAKTQADSRPIRRRCIVPSDFVVERPEVSRPTWRPITFVRRSRAGEVRLAPVRSAAAGVPTSGPLEAAWSDPLLRQRVGPGDDLEDLLGDLRLPRPVHRERERVDQLAGVLRGVAHRSHPRALLGRRG